MIYGFSDYELDTQRYELRRAGAPCKVEPKAFDLLVHLIQNCDRAVTRDELFAHIWSGESISDAVLSHHVMMARKAVGDNGRAQRVIKTVHGRGYRFIAAVHDGSHVRDAQGAASTTPMFLPDPPTAAPPVFEAQMGTVPEAPSPAQNVLAGEHTLGTVLCVILDHVQVLSEQLAFDTLQRLRQTFFTIAQEVIRQYEGRVQFYGADGMLAIFGMPMGQTDHARRGLSAAVALRRGLRDAYANAEALPLITCSVSQGLHTGPVAAGNLTGETPSMAVWLQYQTEPDTILISGATMQLVKDMVANMEQGPIRIPGHAGPIAAYKLGELSA